MFQHIQPQIMKNSNLINNGNLANRGLIPAYGAFSSISNHTNQAAFTFLKLFPDEDRKGYLDRLKKVVEGIIKRDQNLIF